MSNQSSVSTQSSVDRILYKEIQPGDLRKIIAESNDSQTGGGARDFRFGSYSKLEPVIRLMFPGAVTETRKRNGKKISTDLFTGDFFWTDAGGTVIRQNSFFEPPTDARPAEGRITRVNEYDCFSLSKIPQATLGNRVLLLLIQQAGGSVWPYFVTEESLRTPGEWNVNVARIILSCLDARRPSSRAVIGSYDFLTKQSYCNGK